jgi:hypothetical protein
MLLVVFSLSVFFANNAFAQNTENTNNYNKGFRLGLGLNAGYPLADPYKLVLGGDVRLQYDLSKRYSFTVTTGFTNLFVNKKDGSDLGFIPAKAGFKAFVWNDEFYVMAEAGAAFSVTNKYNKSSLLLAPSVGYATKYIDISLHYEQYSDFRRINNDGTQGKGFGQLGLRLAYGFKL